MRAVGAMAHPAPRLKCFVAGRSVQMPSSTQFTYFFAMFAAGVVFLVLAFSIFLPVIILAPAKFALCFTLGSALCMAAFLTLKGWRTQLHHMFSAERLPFSVGARPLCAQPKKCAVLTSCCCSAWVQDERTVAAWLLVRAMHHLSSTARRPGCLCRC